MSASVGVPAPPAPERTSHILVDSGGRLACNRTCLQCGHNLRGLPPAGACGECGSSVALSLSGHPLSAAPPKWLGRVRGGSFVLLLTFPWIWLPLAWPLAWSGAWFFATPDPTPGARGEALTLAVRACLLLQAAAALACTILAVAEPAVREFDYLLVAVAIGVPGHLLTVALATGRLARRAGIPRLRKLSNALFLCWLLGPPGAALLPAADLMPPFLEAPLLMLGIAGAALAAAIPLITWLVIRRAWRELNAADTLGACDQARLTVWLQQAAAVQAAATPTPSADAHLHPATSAGHVR